MSRLKITRNPDVEQLEKNVAYDVENLLYEYGINDWMTQDKIVDLIVDKWCEQKGIDR